MTEPKPWDCLLGAAYECNHTRPWNACFECAIEARNDQIVAELRRRHKDDRSMAQLADDIENGKV